MNVLSAAPQRQIVKVVGGWLLTSELRVIGRQKWNDTPLQHNDKIY